MKQVDDSTSYIRAGWLIDGSGKAAQKDVLLVVNTGQIVSIKPYAPEIIPANGQLTDLSFATILPPLIDSHLHLSMSGAVDAALRENQLVAGCEELLPYIHRHLKQLFDHGVLAVRDGGDRHDCVLDFMAKGMSNYPIAIHSPGRAYHRAGRYGGLIGRAVAESESPAELLMHRNHQPDYLKVVNSGLNSLKKYGHETSPQFSPDELKNLCELAHSRQIKVMVHANGRLPVQQAIEAGCDSIEHGFFMGRDNLERMAEYGCTWVPTIVTMKAYAEVLEFEGNISGAAIAARNYESQLEQLRQAKKIGVKVALGTDSGSPGVLHGESVFEEMKLYGKAGYSLVETVQCATANGAELLGLADNGILQAQAAANFLVARGTPAQLPRKLSYLENIFIAGKPSALYRKNPVK